MWTSTSRLFPTAGAVAVRYSSQQQPLNVPDTYGIHKLVKDPARQDPEYFEREAEKLKTDEHYIDKLKHLYEQKVSNARDLYRKASDFLVANPTYGLPDVDRTEPRIAYRNVDALRDAPDVVKRIFSVEFGERRDLTDAWRFDFMSRVRNHELDDDSIESRIAWATNFIRHHSLLTDQMIVKHPQNKHPKWAILRTTLMIDHRRKLLKKLRESNYESFERVLSELKISYRVRRDEDEIRTRKEWSEHQIRKRCTAEKERLLNEYHKKLLEGREERVTAIDAELNSLENEEVRVTKQLQEIDLLEGRAVADVKVRYEPKLIEEFTELAIQQHLFYHPQPINSSFNGAIATSGTS